jgi:tRNA-uridine 2-sulfurtransferase
VNWMSGDVPSGPIRAHARIRYRHREAPATITPLGDARASVAFDEPQSAITPGQAVVFYEADVVSGGGWID